jgi:hypothetical protein
MTGIATPIIATKAKTAKTNEIVKTILVGAFRFIILFYFVQLVAVAKLYYHFFLHGGIFFGFRNSVQTCDFSGSLALKAQGGPVRYALGPDNQSKLIGAI